MHITRRAIVLLLILALMLGIKVMPNSKIRTALTEFIIKVETPIKMAKLTSAPKDTVLLMPLPTVKVRSIANTWGGDRSGGRSHQGQDIFAPQGTLIFSATKGYVIRIGTDTLGGNVIFILGAGGTRYYYAHLDAISPELKLLQEVDATTVLGTVGTTGNAAGTPPHLHFGMYEGRTAIDPLPLIIDRK